MHELVAIGYKWIGKPRSIQLVEEHTRSCESCREIYQSETKSPSTLSIRCNNFIKKFQTNIYLFGFAILIISSLFGISLSNQQGMFYNLTLIPAIGALGFFMLKQKWIYFRLVFLYLLIFGYSSQIFLMEFLAKDLHGVFS